MNTYYMYAVNNKKALLLASADTKTELQEKTLKKVGDKISKMDGLYLYRIKIKEVPKKEIDKEANSKIKLIGGPFVAIIQKILIDTNEDRTKLTPDETENKIYFGDKYFSKYDTIQEETIDKMVFDFTRKKFNDGLFAVNVINS